MTQISLPSGTIIDFKDLGSKEIESALVRMQEEDPSLFVAPEQEERLSLPVPETESMVEKAYQQYLMRGTPSEVSIGEYGDIEYGPEGAAATNEGEVDDHFFQFKYGRADNDEEREKRLTAEFGENSFIRKGYGDYLLNLDNIGQAKKEEYNLPLEGTIHVNEPGLSWYDVSGFLGGEAAPLGAALGAGLVFSGVGIVPGMLIMGAAGATGKGFDELIEAKFEKMNTQTDDEVYKDIALTGGLYAVGEGLGRGLFAAGRYLLKGPGPKPDPQRIAQLIEKGLPEGEATVLAREEAKKSLRQAVEEGARPTLKEASGKALAGRLQAIYEGIFENRVAAESNRKFIQKKMDAFKEGRLSEADLVKVLDEQAVAIQAQVKLLDRNSLFI